MFKKIVVPLDGSQLAEQALPMAISLANAYDGELFLVQVVTNYLVPPYGLDYQMGESFRDVALREADDYLAVVQRRIQVDVQAEIKIKAIEGLVAENILDYAEFENADVIVMATHGRSGVGRWVFGSIAERVLRASNCPVLLIRADEAKLSTETSQKKSNLSV
jgi:nucleotide-binding universal stress UspA family protein